MEQDAWYGELQQKLHVSEPVAQSKSLYQSPSILSVPVRALPLAPLSVSYRLPPPTVTQSLVHPCDAKEIQQQQALGAQALHPLIPSSALPQVPVVDFDLQHKIAQSTLEHKEKEVARLMQSMQDSIANPTEFMHFMKLLQPASQECTQLQEEFQKNYGPHAAVTSGAAQKTTLLASRPDQSLNRPTGAAGANLDPSTAVLQPTNGSLLGSATGTDPTSVAALDGARPITMRQEYEVLLDPRYIADCLWEKEELLKKIE